jgi:hypothetical protein
MVSTAIIPSGQLAVAPGPSGVLFWGSIGFVIVLFLGFALLWLRRKYHPENINMDTSALSFTMQSIEEMRDAGVIDADEFRRLRASSLGLAAPMTDNDNSDLSGPIDVDDGLSEHDSIDKQQEDNKESI